MNSSVAMGMGAKTIIIKQWSGQKQKNICDSFDRHLDTFYEMWTFNRANKNATFDFIETGFGFENSNYLINILFLMLRILVLY